jgi:hypothetical protein
MYIFCIKMTKLIIFIWVGEHISEPMGRELQ